MSAPSENAITLEEAERVAALARAVFGQALADIAIGRDVERNQAQAWLFSDDSEIREHRDMLSGLGDVCVDAMRRVVATGNMDLVRLAARKLGR